nr:aminotransferase class V-fold PLP-dependent enzyme [Pseudomonadota bacterium]
MTSANNDLEPDAATQRAWLEAAAKIVLAHMASLASAPIVSDPRARDLGPGYPGVTETPLEGGADAALAIVARAAEAAFSTTAPGYLAYVPGGGLFAAAVADLVADVLNRYTGLTAAAPDLLGLENDVLSWLAGEFGYTSRAAGLFTSGGSLATLTAVVAAREERVGASNDPRLATGYASAQAHGSIAAAFRLAGLPPENLRAVPVDRAFRLQPDRLSDTVKEDRGRGRLPFIVVATAGSTNTGAIDPLPQIAALCTQEKLWLHVDGAYGGAFVLCEEGRRRLRGIELADSIAFDPHKGLFLPYGTGCLLLRDGLPSGARSAAQSTGTAAGDDSYLRDVRARAGEHAPASPADFGLELSRPYRGLRVWLPLMLHGAAAFREALAEKLALAAAFHRGLRESVRAGLPIEIVAAPQLTVVAFRLSRLSAE